MIYYYEPFIFIIVIRAIINLLFKSNFVFVIVIVFVFFCISALFHFSPYYLLQLQDHHLLHLQSFVSS